MTAGPVVGLRLVGIEELSAGVLRGRLLARGEEFWTGAAEDPAATAGRHDPVFFHQLGGFGAVALTGDDADAGYLLGVVTADRLAVVQALAVAPPWRGQGVARALLGRFAVLARSAGARAVQAVVDPRDAAARGLAASLGAREAPSPGHAGPGDDRLVLTALLS